VFGWRRDLPTCARGSTAWRRWCSGQAFVFRGRQGRLIKVLWWDGQGLCLFAKRLEKGRFIWPATSAGAAAALTPAQVAMLLEGIDWRAPIRTERPQLAG
jgi:transposase